MRFPTTEEVYYFFAVYVMMPLFKTYHFVIDSVNPSNTGPK